MENGEEEKRADSQQQKIWSSVIQRMLTSSQSDRKNVLFFPIF